MSELRDLVSKAVGAALYPPHLTPADMYVMQEEFIALARRAGGHHGLGGVGGATTNGCWVIKRKSEEEGGGYYFYNCYVWNGSQLIDYGEHPADRYANSIVALYIDSSSPGRSALKVRTFYSVYELNQEAKKPASVVIPLYKFGDDGVLEVDFRGMPRGDSWGMLI